MNYEASRPGPEPIGQAELKGNSETVIKQAKSMSELVKTIYKDKLQVQGSSELYTSEMLVNVIHKIRAGEWPIEKATSRNGFRQKVAELMQRPEELESLRFNLGDAEKALLGAPQAFGSPADHPVNQHYNELLKRVERLKNAIYDIEQKIKK